MQSINTNSCLRVTGKGISGLVVTLSVVMLAIAIAALCKESGSTRLLHSWAIKPYVGAIIGGVGIATGLTFYCIVAKRSAVLSAERVPASPVEERDEAVSVEERDEKVTAIEEERDEKVAAIEEERFSTFGDQPLPQSHALTKKKFDQPFFNLTRDREELFKAWKPQFWLSVGETRNLYKIIKETPEAALRQLTDYPFPHKFVAVSTRDREGRVTMRQAIIVRVDDYRHMYPDTFGGAAGAVHYAMFDCSTKKRIGEISLMTNPPMVAVSHLKNWTTDLGLDKIHGVGIELMKVAVEECVQVGADIILVRSTANPPDFYANLGFTPRDERVFKDPKDHEKYVDTQASVDGIAICRGVTCSDLIHAYTGKRALTQSQVEELGRPFSAADLHREFQFKL